MAMQMEQTRMTKSFFEGKLIKFFDKVKPKDITKERHVEHDGTIVWLYYAKTGKYNPKDFEDQNSLEALRAQMAASPHVGSWCKGAGWIF